MKTIYNLHPVRKIEVLVSKNVFLKSKSFNKSVKIKLSNGVNYFLGKPWSFVLIKNEKIIYSSKAERLKPLIFCIKKHKKEMRGATVFDRVIGQAAAMLLAHAKVKEIWTPTISQDAKKYLEKNKIKIEFKKKIKNIMNRKGDDLCPMEKLSRKMGDKLIKHLLNY